MRYNVEHAPVFSVLVMELDAEESVVAQPNSMLTMTSGIQIKARIGRKDQGHFWSGFKSLLGGESFFTAEFYAKRDGQTLMLAPDGYGDILVLPLESGPYYLTRGAYLASVGACNLQTKYGGLKGVLSKKGLFLLHASGTGVAFCQTFGTIIEKELGDDEHFFVDNRFVVAFSDTVAYQLVKATQSVKDTLMSGEGLVNRYTGPGRIFFQTRGKPSIGFLSMLLNAAT
jgi:uncharacterized protein (TIGR00266 family)